MTNGKKTGLYSSDLCGARWAKSSKSGGMGNCVEVAHFGDGAVVLRDSKNAAMPPLRFTAEEWAAFRDGVRDGEFG
ncbi:DUF397 domain-containing protein [Streptomyces sp. NPDC048281]|uniref:DUF397 domain-containing protein n=1 Tax=Streptomyces sp. NPDC048281 TaxID=3154715 RepID=UPI00343A9B13